MAVGYTVEEAELVALDGKSVIVPPSHELEMLSVMLLSPGKVKVMQVVVPASEPVSVVNCLSCASSERRRNQKVGKNRRRCSRPKCRCIR